MANINSINWTLSNCSSECSDGEWSASLPSYFSVTVKDQSSSDESWETLPGKEEQEPEEQSDSSGVEEEHNEFGFQSRYVILLMKCFPPPQKSMLYCMHCM